MEKKNLAKLFSGLLVGGMLLSFGGVALAGDSGNTVKGISSLIKTTKLQNKQELIAQRDKVLTEALNQLAKDGTLSQDKVSQIKSFIEKKNKEREAQRTENRGKGRGSKFGLFNELVTNNIISQEQADKLNSTIREIDQKQHQQEISNGLKDLVQKKTITQAQSDKIQKMLADFQKDRQSIMEKTKNMTPEERQQYMQTNKVKFTNPLDQLVTDGTITEDQAKEIGQLLPFRNHRHGR